MIFSQLLKAFSAFNSRETLNRANWGQEKHVEAVLLLLGTFLKPQLAGEAKNTKKRQFQARGTLRYLKFKEKREILVARLLCWLS